MSEVEKIEGGEVIGEPKAKQGKGDDPLAQEIEDMMSTLESGEPLVKNRTKMESGGSPKKDNEPPEERSPKKDWEAERQELLDRIDKLTKMVEQLSEVKLQQAQQQQPPLTPPKKGEGEEEEKKPTAPIIAQEPAEDLDFLGDTSVEVLIDEPEKLNQALNKVYQSALVEAERRVFEKVLTSIPDIIVGHLNRQTTIQGIVKDFYDRNKDLTSVKRTVAAVSNDVHAEHPDWEVGQVLEEAAKRTRELLGLRGSAQSKPREETPAFARTGGTKVPPKKTSTLQDEIDELLNFE